MLTKEHMMDIRIDMFLEEARTPECGPNTPYRYRSTDRIHKEKEQRIHLLEYLFMLPSEDDLREPLAVIEESDRVPVSCTFRTDCYRNESTGEYYQYVITEQEQLLQAILGAGGAKELLYSPAFSTRHLQPHIELLADIASNGSWYKYSKNRSLSRNPNFHRQSKWMLENSISDARWKVFIHGNRPVDEPPMPRWRTFVRGTWVKDGIPISSDSRETKAECQKRLEGPKVFEGHIGARKDIHFHGGGFIPYIKEEDILQDTKEGISNVLSGYGLRWKEEKESKNMKEDLTLEEIFDYIFDCKSYYSTSEFRFVKDLRRYYENNGYLTAPQARSLAKLKPTETLGDAVSYNLRVYADNRDRERGPKDMSAKIGIEYTPAVGLETVKKSINDVVHATFIPKLEDIKSDMARQLSSSSITAHNIQIGISAQLDDINDSLSGLQTKYDEDLKFTESPVSKLKASFLNKRVKTIDVTDSTLSGSLHDTKAQVTGDLNDVPLNLLLREKHLSSSAYLRLSDIQELIESYVVLKAFYEEYYREPQEPPKPTRWQRVKRSTGQSVVRASWSVIGAATAATYFLDLL